MSPSPDWVVTRLQGLCPYASPPFTTRTATAFGSAFASRYGSDLLTLKSPSPCSRATPFLVPSNNSGGFPRFARRVPSTHSLLRYVHPIAYRGLLAGLARRCSSCVLIGSSDLGPSRSLPFPCGSKHSTGSNFASVRFLIAAGFHVPDSHCRPGATPEPSERVNHAPDYEPPGSRFPGSRAHQLHPTVLRLPGFISELLAAEFSSRPSSLACFQRTARRMRDDAKNVNSFLL